LDQHRNVTRTELYEKAWSTPMRKLATEFGLSDVALAKICRKNGIPLPGIGYWRLIQVGRKPERQPLPAIQSGQSESITITVREPKPYDVPRKADLGTITKIEVRNDREITHPMAVQTNEHGMMVPSENRASHLKVSANALPRALRILDALFVALEERGNHVSWPSSADAKLKITVDGQQIGLSLTEMFAQKPHTPTQEEVARRKRNLYVSAPNWDYVPTSSLRLSIDDLPYGLSRVRKSWTDGNTQRVENCLGEIVAVLPHIAKAVKIVEEERERRRLRWEEEARQAEKERRRQEEYDSKAKVADEFLQRWRDSKAFRELAQALRQEVENSSLSDQQKQEARVIAEWLTRHADYVDPLTDLEWMIGEFKDEPW
jgi:hypothetical protein